MTRKKLIATLVLVLLPCFGGSAFAQSTESIAQMVQRFEGTMFVVPHRESADGVLSACGLEFAAMQRDFSTKKGEPVKIVGSFYLRLNPNTGLAYVLKAGVFDGFTYDNGLPPSNAFVSAPGGRAPKKAIRVLAENPSFGLFIGALDKEVTAVLDGIAKKKQLVVGFNRKPGQQDVTFLLDLTVIDSQMKDGELVRKKSQEPVDEFMACAGDLINDAVKLLK